MDEDRSREIERLQIEQIRQLDMEELQIEEVDDDLLNSTDGDDDPMSQSGLGDGGAGPYGGFTFDTCLASLHSYLGEVDDTRGRLAFLDGGAILNLPMFYLEGVVLFPEATLPLRVVQSRFIAAVERARNQFDAPYTIGVIRVYRHRNDEWGPEGLQISTIGTTAEIRQYKRLEDGSLNVVARGQQRFRLRRCWIDGEGAPCAEVQIIQEDTPLRTPKDAFAQLASVSNFHHRSPSKAVLLDASSAKCHRHEDEENEWESMSDTSILSDHSMKDTGMYRSAIVCPDGDERLDLSTSSDEEIECDWKQRLQNACHQQRKHKKVRVGNRNESPLETDSCKDEVQERKCHVDESKCVRRAPMSFWPGWVYRMYDSYCLAQRAADMWKQILGAPKMDDLVRKPDVLSFHIASKLPLSESTRQELLEMDGVSYRLQKEIQLLECFDRIRCKNCLALIARRSDMVIMSSDGPLNAFVNPHGYVHEIMTLYNASGLVLIGSPVKEHSWFPGYAWTITNCAACETNMGWLFTATNKKLRPKSFWGIRGSQVADETR